MSNAPVEQFTPPGRSLYEGRYGKASMAPSPKQKDSSEDKEVFAETAQVLWVKYVELAEKYEAIVINSWDKDMDSLLIFVIKYLYIPRKILLMLHL